MLAGIKRLGQTDAARLGHALEARGDVDAVAVECAIVLIPMLID